MNMKRQRTACIWILTVTQILGPTSIGLAVEPERGIAVEADHPAILSGLQGEVRSSSSSQIERSHVFGDTLAYGDRLMTSAQSRAEILVGNHEVVTVEEASSIRLMNASNGNSLVELEEGAVRFAVAETKLAPDQTVSVRTASTQAVTRGGIFHVTAGESKAEQQARSHTAAPRAVHVSYPPPVRTAQAAEKVETYQVEEGTLTLTEHSGTSEPVTVAQGQTVIVTGGHIGQPFSTPDEGANQVPVIASSPHRATPPSGMEKLVSQEIQQAEILTDVINGVNAPLEENIEEGKETEQNAIVATTGGTLTAVSGNGGGGGNSGLPFIPPSGDFFGPPDEIATPGSDIVDPDGNDLFQLLVSQYDPIQVISPGGNGLLTYRDSQITSDGNSSNASNLGAGGGQANINRISTELIFVDGGNPVLTPHMGQAPTERLIVNNFVATYIDPDGGDGPRVADPNSGPARVSLLPFSVGGGFADLTMADVPVLFTREGTNAQEAYEIISQFASSPLIDPSAPLDIDASPTISGGALSVDVATQFFFLTGSLANQETVNGSIQARSEGEKLITLSSGVVLNNSMFVAAETLATSTHVSGYDGSAVAFIGRDVVNLSTADTDLDGFLDIVFTPGGSLNPVNVKARDRLLAVVGGSRIEPDSSNTSISLLTLLDGRLEGPTEPPILGAIPGDVFPSGQVPPQVNGIDRTRSDIPGLIEVINSGTPDLDLSDPSFEWAVDVQSAIVVRGDLDQGVLEASGPLVSLFNSTMRTSGDLVNVQGNDLPESAELMATLQQSNVLQGMLQLNNSQVEIGGHLANFTNGASGVVNGNLVALANNSALTVDGALVAVGSNSSFTLTGGSLVAFGFGSNAVNLTGTAAGCAGCNLSLNIPNLPGIPVLLHENATITVGEGFVPYAGVGQGTIDGSSFNNTVTVSPGAGVVQVANGGTLVLNP